ncbi:MAG: transcriptional repressor NrdR [Phycisphaerales bacterium]|nr:MAG: transcriptional repressor NrdR [Phycisphaerales bacterium]
MRCPFCKVTDKDKVIDSRLTESGAAIRRRRECQACGRRFTTKERVDEEARIFVAKKDGSRVPFDRGKILAGLEKACYKRRVTVDELNALAAHVEEEILAEFDREVPSQLIGAYVARRLRELDKVAYVRYASVYRDFQEPDEFIEEVIELKEVSERDTDGQQQLFG